MGVHKSLNVTVAIEATRSPEPKEAGQFFSMTEVNTGENNEVHHSSLMSNPVEEEETVIEEEIKQTQLTLKKVPRQTSKKKEDKQKKEVNPQRSNQLSILALQNPFEELEVKDFIKGIEEHQKSGLGATIRGKKETTLSNYCQDVDQTTVRMFVC